MLWLHSIFGLRSTAAVSLAFKYIGHFDKGQDPVTYRNNLSIGPLTLETRVLDLLLLQLLFYVYCETFTSLSEVLQLHSYLNLIQFKVKHNFQENFQDTR